MQPDGTVLWSELHAEAVAGLRGVADVPEREARWIIEEATGAEPGEWPTLTGEPATEMAVARFDEMLARRRHGEPIQYVLGHWSFRSLDLFVDRRVLIPRPETEVVAGVAIETAGRTDRPVVVDLGTGSGAIALSIAVEVDDAMIWATDASAEALAVARANLAALGRDATRVSLGEGSWFEALPESIEGVIDVLVANPPYVAVDEELPASVRDHEPAVALFADDAGFAEISHILHGAVGWLREGGTLVIELGSRQAERARALAATLGYFEIAIRADLAGRDRMLVARR